MPEPLITPAGGIPELIENESQLELVVKEILSGTGPIAIDAERASGYRFSARAYLIQIKRTGGGLHLIDPVAVGPTKLWKELSDGVGDEEWIIHASTQDLACLREVGIEPKIIFDTELGGRIAGCERVGLGPLTESLLEITLAKEHSAVDWSLRPLRPEWLVYAALDVELLIELRDKVAHLLLEQGKLNWAMQDFAAILAAPANPPRQDPWRRTSGMHKVKDRTNLAIIRDLWFARDEYAREIDLAPGRVFNDETLVEIATKRPNGFGDFKKLISKRSRLKDGPYELWYSIFQRATELPLDQLPEGRIPSNALPPVKIWEQRNPLGYARITHARAGVSQVAQDNAMPTENLISPEPLRRLCWQQPPADSANYAEFIESNLGELGVRPWQIRLVKPVLEAALGQTTPLVTEKALDSLDSQDSQDNQEAEPGESD